MSGSNWRKFAKTGLAIGAPIALLTAGVLTWGHSTSTEYERQADNHAKKYAADSSRKAGQACNLLASVEKGNCLSEAETKSRENDRYEQDLVAQKQSALWAYVMALAAVFGMALSAIGVLLVWTTFRETREGNAIARDAQRAWLTLGVQPLLVRPYADGGLYIRVNFTAQNLGQTVATDFDFMHEIIFHQANETTESVDRRCAELVDTWAQAQEGLEQSTIVPGGSEISGIWQQYDAKQIHWYPVIPGGKEFADASLLSAVFYRTTSHPELLQCSWRTWYLCGTNSKGETMPRIPKGVELDESRLRIEAFRNSQMHTQRTANDDSRNRGQ